jgi:hypothetical protein
LIVTLLKAMGASSCVSTANDPPTGTDPSPTRPAASSAPVTTVAPSVSVGPVTEPSLPDESPAPTKLRTTDTVISGRSGSVTWRIRVPKFSGAPAAAEVNKRVRAAVNGMIAQTKREGRTDDASKRRLDGEGRVVTNDGRTAQVTITYGDYLEGTAHPTDYVTTTVVDVLRRKPIVLEQVFTHPTAAYKKLKPAILRAAGEQSSGIDQAGLAPKKANWANWQSNTSGMVFVFGDYQLGTHGLREYAVPWSTVDPLLTGYAKRVLAPQ